MDDAAVTQAHADAIDKKVDGYQSELLDPDFRMYLCSFSEGYDKSQFRTDNLKWIIAKHVHGNWSEHKSIFGGVKLDYYAECSRVANVGLISKRKRFADSGETLRRWCEVVATYENFENADAFVEHLSFKHLEVAKSLAYNGKVNVPTLALAEAVVNGWTADEMKYHFDPTHIVHEYDKAIGYFGGLAGLKFEWIKNKVDRDEIKMHIAKAGEIAARYK